VAARIAAWAAALEESSCVIRGIKRCLYAVAIKRPTFIGYCGRSYKIVFSDYLSAKILKIFIGCKCFTVAAFAAFATNQ